MDKELRNEIATKIIDKIQKYQKSYRLQEKGDTLTKDEIMKEQKRVMTLIIENILYDLEKENEFKK